MTRQEEWEKQEAIKAVWLASQPVSQPTGRHKLNTRDRGEYNGYTKSEVLKLIQRSQNAEKKKRYFTCNPSEKEALKAYYKERLASAGMSVTSGTPDGYIVSTGKTAAVDPFITCGSIECRQDIREKYGKE